MTSDEGRVLGAFLAIILLLTSLSWLSSSVFQKDLFPTSATLYRLDTQSAEALEAKEFEKTIALSEAGIGIQPMHWQFHFTRASAMASLGAPPEEIETHFKRMRPLAFNSELPFLEGKVWLTLREVDRATEAFREALKRAGPRSPKRFQEMIGMRRDFPEILFALHDLAGTTPETMTYFIQSADPASARSALAAFAEKPSRLQTWSPNLRKQLFYQWARKGDVERLQEVLQAQPEWMSEGWRALVEWHATEKRYQAACDLIATHATAPTPPDTNTNGKSITQLKVDHARKGGDPMSTLALLIGYEKADRLDDAAELLNELRSQKDCPRYFHWHAFHLEFRRENWEAAWRAWKTYD